MFIGAMYFYSSLRHICLHLNHNGMYACKLNMNACMPANKCTLKKLKVIIFFKFNNCRKFQLFHKFSNHIGQFYDTFDKSI